MTAVDRCPFATWVGPSPNQGGTVNRPARGLVLHVAESPSAAGTISWFNNPKAQASAHFTVDIDGTLYQQVGCSAKAWAEAAGNADWYSVETVGYHTSPLTQPQIDTLARLLAWLSAQDGFPIEATDDPVNGHGFICHGDGGAAWGGHTDCPGPQRTAQRAQIIAAAAQHLDTAQKGNALAFNTKAVYLVPGGVADSKNRLPHWQIDDNGNWYAFNGAPALPNFSHFGVNPASVIGGVAGGTAIGNGVVFAVDDGHQEGVDWHASTYAFLS